MTVVKSKWPNSRTMLVVTVMGAMFSLGLDSTAMASSGTRVLAKWPTASRFAPKLVAGSPRLAVGTETGMDIWSTTTRVQQIGPRSSVGVNVYDINWSANGRYLAWIQAPKNLNSSRSPQLVEYDFKTKHYDVWTSRYSFSGLVPGPNGIVAANQSPSTLSVFRVNDASPGVITIKATALTTLTAYDDGFLANSYSYPETVPTPIARVSVEGVESPSRAVLPATPDSTSLYEVTVASANGGLEAAELGDHTDVCGVGPSSVIYIVNTKTGKVNRQGPPTPATKGSTLRVQSLSFSPSGVLDATMLNCGSSYDKGLTTSLWENAGRGWHKIGSDVLSAARGPGGVLATVTGYVGIHFANFPMPEFAGSQKLFVGGKWIPLGARAGEIAWAP